MPKFGYPNSAYLKQKPVSNFVFLVSEARLNAVTAITIIGEIPEGRSYILAHEIEALRELKVDFNQLVRNAAIECCDAIEWKP